jgi:hypothetical protein
LGVVEGVAADLLWSAHPALASRTVAARSIGVARRRAE